MPTADGGSAAAGPVTIEATDEECELSDTALEAGINTFAITNGGSQVMEVYVYDGDRIVSKKENIGPGTSYELTVDLTEGGHQVECRRGMVGDGIRTHVEVAAAADPVETDPLAEQAVVDYRIYVQGQADLLPGLVEQLSAAIAAGDRAAAQGVYAPSREPWEAIEPVAESFGDLHPRVDVRETDVAEGQEFTGWHRIEKALWLGEDLAPMVPVADQLLADVRELQQRVPTAALAAVSIGNGAKELVDEVATGTTTGAQETPSHTDLHDFQANLDGARRAFEVLQPLVEQNDPQLAPTLTTQFAAVNTALDPYRTPDGGFVGYDTVAEPGRQELARAVDALGEPLSRLAAAAAG